MAKAPTFCHHPEDLNSCRQSLIQACCEGSVGEHCIIEGLRANWVQCREVLLEGLKSRTSPRKGSSEKATAIDGQKNGLKEACKAVVLLGYPLEIKAIPEVFHEAYYKLVRSKIYKFGLRDDRDPSADDVFQNVFANLHVQFRRGASVKGPFAAYVARVTLHECFRGLRGAARHVTLPEDQVPIGTSRSSALLPPSVAENWEHLDHQLSNSNQGDLINRIILAQQCVEGCSTADRLSAKGLKPAWQMLFRMPREDTASFHKKAVLHVRHSSTIGVVHAAADLINAGTAEPHQVAIIFAAGAGMDLEQTCGLINQLCNLSDTAIFARICRIYMVLKPLGMEVQ